jgi:pilus assembly protein CpaB
VIALLAAVATGLTTYWLGRSYLAGRIALAEARRAEQGPTRALAVAARDLEPGEVLSADVLARRSIPVTFAPASGTEADEAAALFGRTLAVSVRAGEPILASALRPGARSRLAERIAPGRRAVTVAADEFSSFAGQLHTGDRVDLLLVAPLADGRGGARARVLLESVPVLASGAAESIDHLDDASFPTSVTFELAPSDAAALHAAMQGGEIVSLLRRPGDSSPAAFHGSTTRRAPARRTATIDLIVGGGRPAGPDRRVLPE